jgi:hypothetical protein
VVLQHQRYGRRVGPVGIILACSSKEKPTLSAIALQSNQIGLAKVEGGRSEAEHVRVRWVYNYSIVPRSRSRTASSVGVIGVNSFSEK